MKEMRFLLIASTFGVLTSVFSDAQLAKIRDYQQKWATITVTTAGTTEKFSFEKGGDKEG